MSVDKFTHGEEYYFKHDQSYHACVMDILRKLGKQPCMASSEIDSVGNRGDTVARTIPFKGLRLMPIFRAQGYLESSKLGKHGAKKHTFEISAQGALESAKLELMSRDFSQPNCLPVLLDITVKVAKENGKEANKKESGGKAKPKRYSRLKTVREAC